jgi:hypothetical protein
VAANLYFLEKHYTDAKRIINTEVETRRIRAQVTLTSGGKPPKVSDAIGWMVEMAGGKQVDYVAAQLSLTVAAIHATTEALTIALLELASHPEIIPRLRNEIIEVLRDAGWSKQALYKMKLMDSFLKESQRLHPVSFLVEQLELLLHRNLLANFFSYFFKYSPAMVSKYLIAKMWRAIADSHV